MPVPTAEMAADLGEPGVLRRRALPPNGVTRAEAVNEKMGQDAIWEHKRGGDKFGKSEDSGLSNTLSTSRSPPSAPRHKDPSPSYTAIMFRIFAGCCLNVFVLEAMLKEQPDLGLLVTFSQFLFIALDGLRTRFDASNPPLYLQPNRVPLRIWLLNVVLFTLVNVLNNEAFGYSISVPVHIVLRSGGSIMTMIVGYALGKRYRRNQVVAVLLITVGVVGSAISNAPAKESVETDTYRYTVGLMLLFVAQFLGALMGVYTDLVYAKFGRHNEEQMFYSHLLGLPIFLLSHDRLSTQLKKVMASDPLHFQLPHLNHHVILPVPRLLGNLLANVLTQYVCISGVNQLAAKTNSLSVSITLNIRKLASLLLSILFYGSIPNAGVLAGAAVVFYGAYVYG